MFTFENVEEGRINEGKHFSKPGAQKGKFIVPIGAVDEDKRMIVQAETDIIDGWEILRAELIMVTKKESGGEFPKQRVANEDPFDRFQMQMSMELVRDLKVWFWGQDVDCVVFIPKVDPKLITKNFMVQIARHVRAKLSIPQFLR